MKTMTSIAVLVIIAVAGTAFAEEAKPSEWTGSVEKTQHNVPRLVVGDTHYRLKASAKAAESVKATLEKIGNGTLTGTFKVTGTTEKDGQLIWIAVDTIEQAKANGQNEESKRKERQERERKERNERQK
jgi:hypothetical protein